MSLESEYFQAQAKSFEEKMVAAILTKRGIAYDGRIAGVDCIVFGFILDPANPTSSVAPLAIVITPEIFDVLEVDATKVYEGRDNHG